MTRHSLLPDPQALAKGLTVVLGENGGQSGPVTVLRREPNVYTSTSPSEVVVCGLADGRRRRLFCKYGRAWGHGGADHRGGVAYEGNVYQAVLKDLPLSCPRFYGAHTEPDAGKAWLVIEYLDRCVRVHKEPAALKLAARWIGRFHALAERRWLHLPRTCLTIHDEDYYLSWVRRVQRFATGQRDDFPWLVALCEQAREWITLLLQGPRTIIHGEFYPLNILLRGNRVYPIDWESAAVGAGEIDLACLTEAWSVRLTRECAREYRQARWPAGPPPGFRRCLAAARLYLAFRWLADNPKGSLSQGDLWYFDQLCSAGRFLGLIPAEERFGKREGKR